VATDTSSRPVLHHRHFWHNFNFWLVLFTAVYSVISMAGLWVAIQASRLARESADAGIATVRAWVDVNSFKFIYSPASARQQIAPKFTMTVENLGKTPAKALVLTVEFAFDDQSGDKQFAGCPETNLARSPFMVAGPPGEPWTFAVENVTPAQLTGLKSTSDNNASVYAHGCVRYNDVMTNQPRLSEFCVRYYGGDSYIMCDNNNLME
jgi:hypothetical protein